MKLITTNKSSNNEPLGLESLSKNKPGQGRKVGTGKFKEPTSVKRIPISLEPVIRDFLKAYERKKALNSDEDAMEFIGPVKYSKNALVALYSTSVSAGFPSPADDHIEKRLDLNDFLEIEPNATFMVRVGGDSMIDANLFKGDYAVVNRSIRAKIGKPIVAIVDGEFTMKILSKTKDGLPLLLKANPSDKFKNIEIKEGMQFEVWGVITASVRKF